MTRSKFDLEFVGADPAWAALRDAFPVPPKPEAEIKIGQLCLNGIVLGGAVHESSGTARVDFAIKRLPGDEFSEDRRYRYLLRIPTGVDNDRIALGVFANPSTATMWKLDATMRRWLNYCRDWGYGWSWTVNVRAWAETDPDKVPADPDAVGPQNDEWILAAAESADLVVCGWGKLGGRRGEQVLAMLDLAGVVPHALRLNADGSPAHPLYLPKNLQPEVMGHVE